MHTNNKKFLITVILWISLHYWLHHRIIDYITAVLAETFCRSQLHLEYLQLFSHGGTPPWLPWRPGHRPHYEEAGHLLPQLEEKALVWLQLPGHVAPPLSGRGRHDTLPQSQRLREGSTQPYLCPTTGKVCQTSEFALGMYHEISRLWYSILYQRKWSFFAFFVDTFTS